MFSFVTLCLAASALALPADLDIKLWVPGDDGVTSVLRNPVPGGSVTNLAPRADVCRNASYDEFQNSPMKDKILDMAKQFWGDNHNRVFVNPFEFNGPPFQYCFKPDTVTEATYSNTPVCSSQNNELGGTVVNGTADVSIQINQGVTSTHEVTVSTSFTTSSTTDVNLEFDIADLFKVGVKESVSVSGTFNNGQSKTTTINQQTIEGVVAHATHPGKCSVQLNVTSCEGTATAQVEGYFKGAVWFSYPKKVNGHWNWDIMIDAALQESERSSPITLSDKVHSTNAGSFTSSCS